MISQLYIDKIVHLYSLTDLNKGALLMQSAKIDLVFAEYDWDDVSRAIDAFYVKKDSTKPPRTEQVLAMLNVDPKVRKVQKTELEEIQKPTTNIKYIQDCFYDVCRLKYMYGIAYSDYFDKVEHLPYGNKMRVVVKNKDTNAERYELVNLAWLWEDAVVEAKERFPDVFEKFKYANENEKYAIAYKLGVLKLDLNKGKKIDTNS